MASSGRELSNEEYWAREPEWYEEVVAAEKARAAAAKEKKRRRNA